MSEIKFIARNEVGNWIEFNLEGINPAVDLTKLKNVCRFTEFSDKNETEIYEGHILKCHDGLHGKDFIGVVKMQDGCWSIDFSHLPDGHRPFDYRIGWNRDSDYLKMYHPVLGNSMEIIGNIYENPELLNDGTP